MGPDPPARIGVTLRPLTRDDVPEAARLWNDSFIHDRAGEERLGAIIFGDRNHDQDSALAAVEDGRIAGFVSCIAPPGPQRLLRSFAYVKAVCARSYETGGAADVLLGAAEKLFTARGKEAIKVIEYAGGGYFFPGIDLRYADRIELLIRNRYERVGEIQDVEADLDGFSPRPEQRELQQRIAAAGIEVVPYDPSMLETMKELVAAIRSPFWFREGWEEGYRRERDTFVAIRDGEVLGYANYHPGPRLGGFGTTAVLPQLRGQGIGSCLLIASMLKMKELGTPKVVAGWANTPFYLKNGWSVARRYATFRKPLG
jgi:predicted N-acetyltransferase YhbS